VAFPVQSPDGVPNHETMDQDASHETYRRRLRWGLGVFLAIALFFLWQEHRAHLLGALPWLLLLVCPLMHSFIHRGHRSHHHDKAPSSGEKKAKPAGEQHEQADQGCC
jgi:hypothetical protein